jgi:hypothetical protein
VTAGNAAAITDASGRAALELPPGTHRVRAAKPGLVPSFIERVVVR